MSKLDMEKIWRSKNVVSAMRVVRWTTGGWKHMNSRSWLH